MQIVFKILVSRHISQSRILIKISAITETNYVCRYTTYMIGMSLYIFSLFFVESS